MKLKVMSYNVQAGKNDEANQERNYDFCAKVIEQQAPDITGLNELGRHFLGEGFPTLDLGCEPDEYLGEKLGLHHAFGKAIMTRDGCPYGNGILTRMPILSSQTVSIPDPERREKGHYESRSVLVVRIAAEKEITVLVSHFGLQDEERVSAVKTVLEIIEGINTPIILMGDFNCTPTDSVLLPLYERLNDTGGGAASPYTWPSNPDRHKAPPFKIDYIFTSKNIKTVSTSVIESFASDHKPLVCELEL